MRAAATPLDGDQEALSLSTHAEDAPHRPAPTAEPPDQILRPPLGGIAQIERGQEDRRSEAQRRTRTTRRRTCSRNMTRHRLPPFASDTSVQAGSDAGLRATQLALGGPFSLLGSVVPE